ncbi:MAG: LapA family protein [Bacteroidia bacterium]|jgi:uncharacterized integral membrane protein|nr:LapA family protein [Bacteroidia bacterium]MCO5253656.1 LapA family protein [Bacteroidota bacterium]MCO6494480.1 LapA family protein [Bacteroidota bacterium]MCZ2130378.1 LapA family protein [Bacteroidia bacterium]
MNQNKPDKNLFRLIATLVLVGLIVTLALQNSSQQVVTFYFWSFSLPLFVLLFLAFVIGILLMIVLLYPKYRRTHKAEEKAERLEREISRLEKKIAENQNSNKHE